MLSLFAIIESHLTGWLASPLLAQVTPPVEKSMSVPWAIVLFFIILGLIVTLSPAKRTTEIKRSRDD